MVGDKLWKYVVLKNQMKKILQEGSRMVNYIYL